MTQKNESLMIMTMTMMRRVFSEVVFLNVLLDKSSQVLKEEKKWTN